MLQRWNHRGGHYALLLAVGAVLFFVNLGGATLWDVDEGRNATASYEMMESGNWIKPTFNGELRPHKPALFYWLQICAYRTFGVSEFSARLPSALAALLTLLLTYELGRSMFNMSTGLLAGLIIGTCLMFNVAARFSNQDALLNFCAVLTMLLFWRRYATTGGYAFFALAIAMALGMMAKGPIGLVLPLGVIVLFLLCQWQWRILLSWKLIPASLLFALIALPWYILVAAATKGAYLRGFFGTHNVNRFFNAMEDHGGGPHFYFLVLLIGCAPWSMFAILSLWHGWLSARIPFVSWWASAADRETTPSTQQPPEASYRFLWCWLVVYYAFFSMAATKLPNYILPVTTPLALLTARALERWYRGALQVPAWLMHASLASLFLVGVATSLGMLIAGGAVSLPVDKMVVFDGLAVWSLVGLVPVVGASVSWWYFYRQRRGAMMTSLGITAVLFLVVLTGGVLEVFNTTKAAQPLARLSGADDTSRNIYLGGWDVGHLASLHFYCRRHINHFQSERDALAFLKHRVPVYLFVSENAWEQMRTRIRTPHRVIFEHTDLYQNGRRVVVVTNEVGTARR